MIDVIPTGSSGMGSPSRFLRWYAETMSVTWRAGIAMVLCSACRGGDGPGSVDAPTAVIDARVDAAGLPYVKEIGPELLDFFQVQCGGYRTAYIQWQNVGTGPMTWSVASADPRFTFDPSSGTTEPDRGGIIVAMARAPVATSVAGVDVMADAILTSNLIDSPHVIPMKMTPHGATVTVAPDIVDFGEVQVPSYYERTATFRNVGTIAVAVTLQPPGPPFQRAFGSQGTMGIAAEGSADALFTFGGTSESLGSHEMTANISVSAPFLCGAQPVHVTVRGTGVSP